MGLLQDLRAGPALPKEPIRYRSSDGLEITGLMCKPEGDGPFPLIAVNHGGFEPAHTIGGMVHLFAKLGYVAVASDYRGAGGSQGRHELALGEVDDVLSAIRWARSLPFVDGSRTVTFGVSHGGMISLLAAARDPGIRAVVDIVAPTEPHGWYRHVRRAAETSTQAAALMQVLSRIDGLTGWTAADWARRSPLAEARRIKCPVLLVYGAKDEIVPPSEGEAMMAALHAGGTEATLVIDPAAGHFFDGEAWNRVVREFINFLNRRVGLPTV
jgi:dipeptidyl aminopeptidase/acylaminoacyl peptidase